MSGVFGVIDCQNPTGIEQLLPCIGQSLNHRPWYQIDTSYEVQKGIGLGRVGIGVFNSEAQPAISEDGGVVLFMAGEFYDWTGTQHELEQKRYQFRNASQAEFALRLYQDQGIDFVKTVEGVFVITIWDQFTHQLLIVNDRFGLKPLYYSQFNDKFIFAPEIKGILADQTFSKKLNLTALAEYIRFQMLLGEKTFFEDITLLPPASILRVEIPSLQIKRQRYWSWNDIPLVKQSTDEREIATEGERLLRRAVNIRLAGAERPGVLLSGGLDSRLILALIEPQYQPVKTITYGHQDCYDVHIAAQIARTAGSQHHHFELKDGNWVKEIADFHLELTEGSHSWVHAHGMSILPEVRQLIDVNLSGIAGLITGMVAKPEFTSAPDQEALINQLFLFYTQHHTWPGLSESEAATLYTSSYQKQLAPLTLDSLKAEVALFDDLDPGLRATAFNIANRDRRMIANFLVFNSSHFENRCPFYDYRFGEWVIQLPNQIKAEKLVHRLVLSRVAPRLALIPRDKDRRLPIYNQFLRDSYHLYSKIIGRTKRWLPSGKKSTLYAKTLYADYENYLRHELRDWAEGILFDDRTLARGIFRPEALRSLMDRHLAGHELHTIGKIAPIMTFEMMMRRFFDT